MISTKRRTLLGALAASPLFSLPVFAQSTALKISHQFPGGTATEGDFRDRLCRMFSAPGSQHHQGIRRTEHNLPGLVPGQGCALG